MSRVAVQQWADLVQHALLCRAAHDAVARFPERGKEELGPVEPQLVRVGRPRAVRLAGLAQRTGKADPPPEHVAHHVRISDSEP